VVTQYLVPGEQQEENFYSYQTQSHSNENRSGGQQ